MSNTIDITSQDEFDAHLDEFAARGWYTVLTPNGDFVTGPLESITKMLQHRLLLEKLPTEGPMQ